MSDREVELLDGFESIEDIEDDLLSEDEREYEESQTIPDRPKRPSKAVTVFDNTTFGTRMRERGEVGDAMRPHVKKSRYGWN